MKIEIEDLIECEIKSKVFFISNRWLGYALSKRGRTQRLQRRNSEMFESPMNLFPSNTISASDGINVWSAKPITMFSRCHKLINSIVSKQSPEEICRNIGPHGFDL
uniref:Uncharacterized protein n=1 Tax=Syphacia muris TaxID=451379 RepID=A0A0N5AX93_9BILA